MTQKKNHAFAIFDHHVYLTDTPSQSTLAQLDQLGIPGIHKEYQLLVRFLLMYAGSEDTFKSYRRECERLCQWAWVIHQDLVKTIDRHALTRYFQFIQNPPQHWVSTKYCDRFIGDEQGHRSANPEWRPFLNRTTKANPYGSNKNFQLSQASMRAAMAGVSTLMTYCQQENYISQNPALLLRQKSRFLQKTQQSRITRKLSVDQWQCLIELMTSKAKQNPSYQRLVFIFSAFYLLGCRISELADDTQHQASMGDFFQDNHKRWWFKTVGKGNKKREIAVPDVMLTQLKHYRQSLGLPALPMVDEPTPLIPKIKGHGGIGIRQLRKLVQQGFDETQAHLKSLGQVDEAHAMTLATAHWLRHTAISHDVLSRPRAHVRDDAGHQSITITDRYIDIDLKERHASAKHKTLVPIESNHPVKDTLNFDD